MPHLIISCGFPGGVRTARPMKIGLRRNRNSGLPMQKSQLPEQLAIWVTASFRETERACLALVETEIEVAFSFLRLAEVESSGGNGGNGAGLSGQVVSTQLAV